MTRPAVRFALAAVAAIAFTLAYLHISSQVGRLSRDLQYDDVIYALDGASRLDNVRREGLRGFHTFVTRPAHSYLAAVQSMAAQAVGGMRDLALYASNAWLLLAVAFAITLALRDRSTVAWAAALLFALSSPLAYYAIGEFRPDIALGLATALMAWFFLEAGFSGSRRALRWAGYLLAASLVVKSTFFAHTLALAIGLALAGLAVAALQRYAWVPRFRLAGRDVAIFLGIGLALALPFYLVNGAAALEYFWSNTAGAKGHVWNYDASLSLAQVFERFKPLMFALARLQSIAAAIVAFVAAVSLWRRDRAASARIVGLLAVATVSAAIIVLGRQPSQFFFATMHWLVLFAGLYGWVRLHDHASPRGRHTLSAAAAVAIVALAIGNSRFHDVPWPAGAEHGNSWNERIVGWIEADLRRTTPKGFLPPANVLTMTASAVNPDTLGWVGGLRGVRLLGPQLQLLSDLAQGERDAEACDYVILPNLAFMVSDGWLPLGKIQQPMLDWIRTQPQFERLGPGDAKQWYYVFANRKMHPAGDNAPPGASR